MVIARLQEREEPRKRQPPVELPVWRVHFQLVSDPCRRVDQLAGVLICLSPEGLRQRHLRVAKQTGGLQTGRHIKLERHGYSTLNHIVVLRGVDRRVLAANPTVVE